MTRISCSLLACFAVLALGACKHQPYVSPATQRTGDPTLCFDRDILPIFLSQCAKAGCHDAAEAEEGYVLDSYDNIVKKGIAAGNAAGSIIYRSLLGQDAKQMPEDADPLSVAQIAIIKRWIDAGAIKDANCTTACDSNSFAYSTGVRPLIERYCLGCHSGSQPQGALLLTSYAQVKAAVQSRNLLPSIRYQNGYQPMPQGLRLSDCEVRQVEKWVEAGMPDN